MSRVCIAMSGGVDSSVAAALLQQQGLDVAGIMMRLQPHNDTGDAARVCAALGIPFEVLEAQAAFREAVIAPFIDCYRRGQTPNPCTLCNRRMKFGRMLDWALARGYDTIATGHYARIERSGERYALRAGDDPSRDQTYFLYCLTQRQLAHSCFPIGTLAKQRVRAIAEEFQLPVAQKKDSQDICFIPDGDYAAYLQTQGLQLMPGRFLHEDGRELGPHRGAERYTLGQRKGLGLSCGAPVYVLRKEGADVIVGSESSLYSRTVFVQDCNWVSIAPPTAPIEAEVALRYTRNRSCATVIPTQSGVELRFTTPQRAVTPGQAAVFYDGPYVLGGGTISGSK